MHGVHDDTLHKVLLERLDGPQLVDRVEFAAVCCGVAKYEERVQRVNGMLCLFGIVNALRLVDNHDGLAAAHQFLRAATTDELLTGTVEDVCYALFLIACQLFVESTNVDDHDLD